MHICIRLTWKSFAEGKIRNANRLLISLNSWLKQEILFILGLHVKSEIQVGLNFKTLYDMRGLPASQKNASDLVILQGPNLGPLFQTTVNDCQRKVFKLFFIRCN